ncbi:hypothetical protein BJX76DRAFT_331558 [Aspergillus varians]
MKITFCLVSTVVLQVLLIHLPRKIAAITTSYSFIRFRFRTRTTYLTPRVPPYTEDNSTTRVIQSVLNPPKPFHIDMISTLPGGQCA